MKNKLAVCAALCALLAMVTASAQVIVSCRDALRLCMELILPALFPFFVISNLLSRLGLPGMLGQLLAPGARKLFRISGPGATALLLGLTGGFPLGAAYIADLERNGNIPVQEAEKLLVFCNNSGPAFILGAVGAGIFDSPRAGLLLYAAHILSALCIGLLFRQYGPEPKSLPPAETAPLPLSQALPEAVRQSLVSVLSICGFVVCFSTFTGLLDTNGFFSAAAAWLSRLSGLDLIRCRVLLCGFLELGSGVGAMRGLAPSPDTLALAAGLMGWGGISVQLQTLAVLADSNSKGALHLAGRLMSAVIGACFAYILALLLL